MTATPDRKSAEDTAPAHANDNIKPSRLHAHARDLAEAGIKIFPVEENGKRPAISKEDGGNGFHDATTELAKIDAWWTKNPNFNIGMCPEDAGWAVVDIDSGGESGWIEALTANGGYEPTYEVSTPSGGRHIYFAGSLASSAGKLAAHVDTRGQGGYVLVPPSIVNGKAYTVKHDRPIVALPPWIGRMLASKSVAREASGDVLLDVDANVNRAISAVKAELEKNGPPVEGDGSDNRTYAVAAVCRDLGVSEERTVDLLHDVWAPHFTRDWLEVKIHNVWNHAQNAPGVDAIAGTAADTFGKTAAFQEAMAVEASKPLAKRLTNHRDWQQEEDVEWLFDDFLQRETVVTVNGKSQSFKSFIIGEVLYSVATGLPAFTTRKPEVTGSTVYVPVEGKRGFKKRRVVALTTDRKAAPDDLYIYETVPLLTDETACKLFMADLRDLHRSKPIQIVALDHAAGVLGALSANDRENLQQLWALARTLIEEFKCVVMVAVHPPKSASDDDANAAGTYGFFADVDTFLQVSRRKGTRYATVSISKQKEGEEGREIHLRAKLIEIGKDKKNRPVSSFVLEEISAEAVADERDQDRVTVEWALERAGATSEARAIDAEELARAIARVWDPEFPEGRVAVSGGKADLLDKARKLVRRMRVNDDAADLRFKAGAGRTAGYRWRLLPKAERTLPPARQEPPTMGTVPDRKEGEL
ncbi:MAG TPA: bifunctional DNA primase/polymerase [Reyranella sp.]|nr:bifunctional DNA primase/polymerase [Reyranella sp.]